MSTFGSAGDLFPLLPLIIRLKADGHDVQCAVSRSLGLYLRAAGVAPLGLGDGSEMRVIDDPAIFTRRFDGWASWRRTLNDYVAPTLSMDVAKLEAMFAKWRPDVVLASGFAAAARISAHHCEVPVVTASIYPQHRQLGEAGDHLALGFRRAARALMPPRESSKGISATALWGAPPDVLLHDASLLADRPLDARVAIGFPYWDQVMFNDDECRLVEQRLARSGPHVVVTLGSFVGLAARVTWLAAAEAIATAGASAVFVGARGKWASQVFAERRDILCVGFVPLTPIFERAAATIHHGGIGTMFGALRRGCPAVVLPQAFDQGFNARLVERAGVGLDGTNRSVADALASVLGETRYRQTAESMSRTLVPIGESVDALVNVLHETIARAK